MAEKEPDSRAASLEAGHEPDVARNDEGTRQRDEVAALRRRVASLEEARAERDALIVELERRNAELDRFAYTVSHDMRSPLITISGFIGHLRKDLAGGDAEQVERDLDRIASALATMDRLLEEVLELSRAGRIVNQPEEIELARLAREAVSMLSGRLEAHGVSVTVDDAQPRVVGDPSRLVQVYQNLIDNAAKFMGPQPDPRIEIGAVEAETGNVVCHVRDNGIGIDASDRDCVFDLFHRLDMATPGTGIGLALTRRIVEVHGGRVWVESAGRGTGSTFYFTLPAGAPTS